MASTRIGFLPAQADLIIYRGDDIFMGVRVTAQEEPVDLTLYQPESHIRLVPEDPNILAEFTIEVEHELLRMHLPNESSAALPDRCVWDVQVIGPDGLVTTLAFGNVQVLGEVTR